MFNINSQEERFVKLASSIAEKGSSIENIENRILKIAQEEEFNSDQIRRLSEATNQILYSHMMNDGNNKFDKTASFPIIDPKSLISRYYKETDSGDLQKVAEEINESMFSYYKSPRQLVFEKTAQVDEKFESVLEERKPLDPNKEYFRKLAFAKKIRDELKSEKNSLHLKIADCIDSLACLFSYDTGPDQASFEKEAFAYFGNNCIPFLNVVRDQMSMPKLKGFSGDLEKLSHIIIDTNTQEFDFLKKAMEYSKQFGKISRKLNEVINVVGEF